MQKKQLNAKVEENFNLKQLIETKRKENEKIMKKLQAIEDQFNIKCEEVESLHKEVKELKLAMSNRSKGDN